MWEKLILIVCSALTDLIANLLTFFVDVVLIAYNLLPTDPVSGLLNVSKEPFVNYLPYINWFIPFDYVITLTGAVLDAYGLYMLEIFQKNSLCCSFIQKKSYWYVSLFVKIVRANERTHIFEVIII